LSRKPCFRQFDGWWYAQIRVGRKRQQIRLVKGEENEKEAYQLFCRLMAEHGGKLPEPVQLQVSTLCDLFLEHSEKQHQPQTHEWYQD
jgi:hypothetical protein